MTLRPLDPRKSERGAAILYVAVFLLVSLWFVSMAIDVGKVMAARTELQAAADAAALAGASAIDFDTGQIIPDTARVRAAAVALQNRAYEDVQTPIVIDPVGDVDFPSPTRVRVRVHREEATGNPVLLHFAQTLGIPRLSVIADATAEVSPLRLPCEHLAPFAPQVPPSGEFSTECDSVYSLKVGSGAGQQGNYQLLDYPDCNEDEFSGGGAAAIREYTVNGYDCCLEIDQEFVLTEPGNKVGPFRQALIERWDRDTCRDENICFDEYLQRGGNNSRLFFTPIIESFDVNGAKYVRILKFAGFFLRERPSGSMAQTSVKGQFVRYVVPGYSNGPPVDSDLFGVHLVE